MSEIKVAASVNPKAKKVKNPKVLSGVPIQELRDAGAVVNEVGDEALLHIRMEFGDAAFKVYESWVSALPK